VAAYKTSLRKGACGMGNKAYLSSTLDDLRPFRAAALEALRKADYVAKDSYLVSAEPTVDQCLKDVGECDIYVGVFAGRYGWRPDGPDGVSITEREYREAVRTGKPRYIFIVQARDCGLQGLQTDAGDKDYASAAKQDALLAELQGGKAHTCAFVKDPTDLALKITQGVPKAEALVPPPPRIEPGGMFTGAQPHPNRLDIGLLIVGVRGCDDAAIERLRQNLPDAWQPGTGLFSPESAQADADRLALDAQLARSRCVALFLSPPGLGRLRENPDAEAALLRLLAERLGSYAILLDKVAPTDVPPTWPAPTASFALGQWLATGTNTLGGELAELVQRYSTCAPAHRDVANQKLVGLAWSVLAMTQAEAREVAAQPELVKDELGKPSFDYFSAITGALAQGGDWTLRYGAQRADWQPFGKGSIQSLLQEVVDGINRQTVVPKRDRTALLGNHIKLRYYPFDAAMFQPGSPDWPLLEAMRGRPCLMLVDELSTLHPALHGKADVFLSDPLLTVASLSSMDPATFSLQDSLKGPQKLGVLVDRFSTKLDPRCELAINNAERVRRWLRQAVPQALAGVDAEGPNPQSLAQFLSNPSGRA
jgi:hypothetical protein